MAGTTSESEQQQSSIPGLSSVTDAAGAGVGKAQEGISAGGSGVQTVTGNIPVVGKVTEGVGNAPVAQKIAGKDPEAEQKGYLQGAYEYVSGAGKVVYDAAGNVIGTVGETASGYLAKAPKDGDGNDATTVKPVDASKLPAREEGEEESSYISRLKNLVLGSTETPPDAASSGPTTDSAADTAKTTTTQAAETYGAATDDLKHGRRALEDTAQSGLTDTVAKSTDAASSSGPSSSNDDNQGTAAAANRTVDAAKDSTRAVEDQAQDTTTDAVHRSTAAAASASDHPGGKQQEEENRAQATPADAAKGAAGAAGDGAQAALGTAGQGVQGAAGGLADTGKGVGRGVGDGVGKVGGVVGLGSGSGS